MLSVAPPLYTASPTKILTSGSSGRSEVDEWCAAAAAVEVETAVAVTQSLPNLSRSASFVLCFLFFFWFSFSFHAVPILPVTSLPNNLIISL